MNFYRLINIPLYPLLLYLLDYLLDYEIFSFNSFIESINIYDKYL